jgi:hypothetical protein
MVAFALLSRPAAVGRENVVLGVAIQRLLKPSQQILRRVLVQWYSLLRCLCLAPAHDLVHNRPLDVDVQICKVEVVPLDSSQLATTQSRRHIQEQQHALPSPR